VKSRLSSNGVQYNWKNEIKFGFVAYRIDSSPEVQATGAELMRCLIVFQVSN
jgi:hypothetical protein